jgi:hypothetical protein
LYHKRSSFTEIYDCVKRYLCLFNILNNLWYLYTRIGIAGTGNPHQQHFSLVSAPDEDRYGYARHFLVCTDQQLVHAYNREVGKDNWTNGRADYLFHLQRELAGREVDCSAVISGRVLSMKHRVTLVNNKLIVSDNIHLIG